MAEPHGVSTWNTLPPEIHDVILNFFCNDIITRYIRNYTSFNAEKASREPLRLLTWPPPPQPLIDLSSATRTCRSFYQFLHRFKIKGQALSHHLQLHQKKICRKIRREVFNLLSLGGEYGRIDGGVFMQFAGVFWKNPLPLSMESTAVLDIMEVLNNESLIMLVPHLEQWVLAHASPISEEVMESPPFVDQDIFLGSQRRLPFNFITAVFETGSSIVYGRRSTDVTSIKGVYEGPEFEARGNKDPERQSKFAQSQAKKNQRLIEKCPVFKELGKGSGEWWLFNVEDRVNDHRGWWWIIRERGYGETCVSRKCVTGMMFGT